MPKTVNELLNSDRVLLQDDGTTGGTPIMYYPPSLNRFTVHKVPYYRTTYLISETYTNDNSGFTDSNGWQYRPWLNLNYDSARGGNSWNNYDNGKGYAFATFTTQYGGLLDFNLSFKFKLLGTGEDTYVRTFGTYIALYCYNGNPDNEPSPPTESDELFYNGRLNSSDATINVVTATPEAGKFYKNYDNYILLSRYTLDSTDIDKYKTLTWSGWVNANTKFAIVGRFKRIIPHTSYYINDPGKDYLYYTMYVPNS